MSLNITFEERKLTSTSSPDDVEKLVGDKSVVVLLLPLEEGKGKAELLAVDKTIISGVFNSLLVQRKGSDLQAYNKFNIPLDDNQWVVIIKEDDHLFKAMRSLLESRKESTFNKLFDTLHLADKYQIKISSELRALLLLWFAELAEQNQEFWNNLRDNFNPLFQKRRFRLELEKNALALPEAKQLIAKAEADVKQDEQEMLDEDDPDTKYELTMDEYQKVLEDDKKYADMCDETFKQSAINKDMDLAITEIFNKLQEWKEYGMLIHLWTLIATSHEHYHLALKPEIYNPIASIDSAHIMYQFKKHLIYLMFREECCVKRNVTPEHRFITSLKQLDTIDFKNLPISPDSNLIPHNGRVFGYQDRKEYMDYYFAARFRSFQEFKTLLRKCSMGVLEGMSEIKELNVAITGGLLSLCAIHTIRERSGQQSLHGGDLPKTTHDSSFQDMLEKNYKGADLDIAIFAKDEGSYLQQLMLLQQHINHKLGNAGDSKSELTFVPKESATGTIRFNLTLPNHLILEVFQVKEGRNAMSLVYNFHVPCVRMSYDPVKDDVFILPSALYAGLTGICLDIKYFSSGSSPMQIVTKYMKRGFVFVLNECEAKMLKHCRYLIFHPNERSLNSRVSCTTDKVWGCSIQMGEKRAESVRWHVNFFYYPPLYLKCVPKVKKPEPEGPCCTLNCSKPEAKDGICQYHLDKYGRMGIPIPRLSKKETKVESKDVEYFMMSDPNKPIVKAETKICDYVHNYGSKSGKRCEKEAVAGKKKCKTHRKNKRGAAKPKANLTPLPPSVYQVGRGLMMTPTGWAPPAGSLMWNAMNNAVTSVNPNSAAAKDEDDEDEAGSE